MMQLRVVLPTEVLIDEPVSKIVADAENGSFCLLPRHIDFVTALVPGVLCFIDQQGVERFAAIDEGTLVKCGEAVAVSVFNGVLGPQLEALERLVAERFIELDEQDRRARSALARLEAGALRGFRQLKEPAHG